MESEGLDLILTDFYYAREDGTSSPASALLYKTGGELRSAIERYFDSITYMETVKITKPVTVKKCSRALPVPSATV